MSFLWIQNLVEMSPAMVRAVITPITSAIYSGQSGHMSWKRATPPVPPAMGRQQEQWWESRAMVWGSRWIIPDLGFVSSGGQSELLRLPRWEKLQDMRANKENTVGGLGYDSREWSILCISSDWIDSSETQSDGKCKLSVSVLILIFSFCLMNICAKKKKSIS